MLICYFQNIKYDPIDANGWVHFPVVGNYSGRTGLVRTNGMLIGDYLAGVRFGV